MIGFCAYVCFLKLVKLFMVSELNYPLLNFEVVKSAKFFHLFYFVWQPNRLRGLAVSEPTCVCVCVCVCVCAKR